MTRIVVLWSALLALAGCAAPKDVPVGADGGETNGYVSRLEDPRALALFHYGQYRLLADGGEETAALEALQRAIELDPDNEELRFELADYLLELDQFKQAIRTIEDVLIRNPDSLESHLRLGNAYAAGRQPEQAAHHYRRILALDPGNEQVHLQLIVVLARSGDLATATDVARQLVERRPDTQRGRLALARLYRESKLDVLAVEQYRLLIDHSPDYIQGYLELGLLYEERRQWPEALAVFRGALEHAPGQFFIHHHLARIYVAMKRYTDALGELQLIVRENPDDYDARRKIGLIYLEQEKWDKAITTFREILAARPELEAVRYYLGTAQARREAWQAALDTFEQIGADSPFYDDALGHISYIYAQTGRGEQAIALLSTRLGQPEPRPQHFYYLAILHSGSDRDDEALEILDRGLTRYPGNSELLYEKGLTLERLGRKGAASDVMRELVKVDPDHAEALNFIAYSLAEESRDLEEALRLAQRAVALKPGGHVLDTLGWVYYRLGRYSEARREIEAALKLLPDDPVILEHLADVLVHLDRGEGLRVYQRVLELDPDNPAVRDKLRQLVGAP